MTAAYDFRKEEDVKAYLHNIGIEYRFQCYSEKKPNVCHLLGMYLHNIKKDTEQAKKVFKVNCDQYKNNFSCYKYAYLLDQEKRSENLDDVIHYYVEGCEAGDYPKSCFMAGARCGSKAERESEPAVKKEYFSKALKYMDRACNEGVGPSCFNLSSIYYRGIPELDMKPGNLAEVFKYTVKACENSHLLGCVNLSLMYLKGEGTEKNFELAKKYQNKAKELQKGMMGENPGLQFEEGLANT